MPITRHAAEMVAEARQRITEIDAADALHLVGDGNTVFVDLRDIRERVKLGTIPGAFHCPRGMAEFWADPESPYFKPVFAEEKHFLFYCGSGWRSALTVKTLQAMGFGSGGERIAHITGGFTEWQQAGGEIEQVK